MQINYEEMYKQEVNQFNDINKRFGLIDESNIGGSYSLMVDSLQAYNRWSYIKLEIKKELSRGQQTALKDRLEEICKYLKEVHTTSRMIWSKARDDLKVNREE